jgi:hypothetical protein
VPREDMDWRLEVAPSGGAYCWLSISCEISAAILLVGHPRRKKYNEHNFTKIILKPVQYMEKVNKKSMARKAPRYFRTNHSI